MNKYLVLPNLICRTDVKGRKNSENAYSLSGTVYIFLITTGRPEEIASRTIDKKVCHLPTTMVRHRLGEKNLVVP